ncbi:MAG: hypothetical protein SFU87_12465 [Chitinophagaceae bacterium]|nr:hypothetical protein [Chitinophagaceae bacterium]
MRGKYITTQILLACLSEKPAETPKTAAQKSASILSDYIIIWSREKEKTSAK